MNACSCLTIRGKKSFSTYSEHDDLVSILAKKGFVEVPITVQTTTVDYDEKWLRCPECGQVWSLMPPDFPFPGRWAKILVPVEK